MKSCALTADRRAAVILESLRDLWRAGATTLERKRLRKVDRLSADYFDLRIYGPNGKPSSGTDWKIDLDSIFAERA